MQLDIEAFAVKRRGRRRTILWPAHILSRPEIRCALVDISISGARMMVNAPLTVGEIIKVRSSRFTAEAQVAWTGDGCVGLTFIEPNERLERALDAP